MRFYYAPMEGITGYIYRRAHSTYFPGIDKYFTPFIQPVQNRCMNFKERSDVLPEHNPGIYLVPQILTNRAEEFIKAARELEELGYQEVNLNLGCPSKTVVTKMRGSGFLGEQVLLERFLDEIFETLDMKISIKTRIGIDDPEEFYELIERYNRFPLQELIIHPRLQTDYYKNSPNLKVFSDAMTSSKNPVCYNGDIFVKRDYDKFTAEFPEVDTVMAGRGLLVNPGMIQQITDGVLTDKDTLRKFHDMIYADYQEVLSGGKNVLFKMKEIWSYMIHIFTEPEKYAKKIKKAEKLAAYETAVEALFKEQDIIKNFGE